MGSKPMLIVLALINVVLPASVNNKCYLMMKSKMFD